MQPSRRDLLKTAAASALASTPLTSLAYEPMGEFNSILRTPDLLRAFDEKNEEVALTRSGDTWKGGEAEISLKVNDAVSIFLNGGGISRIQLRWRADLTKTNKIMGDHWERSYADLEWRGDAPNRILPWYFMANDGKHTHGYGVRTGAGALCFWTADAEGLSLWADVRSGGMPVELKGRTLRVADVICREGKGESAFAATRAFCGQMCPNPLIPDKPVYGTNDWNFAYGNSSAELILNVAKLVSELSPDSDNRPYSVIDEGWQMGPYNNNFGHGPWVGNPRFGEMSVVADKLKASGIRPGLWFRPLTPLADTPKSWLLSRSDRYLDPTIPEVHQYVAGEITKFVGWGYEMIKHDFTSWDFLGKWGFDMGSVPTKDGWKPDDASRTNAEILTSLYQTIRKAAGFAKLIGCNTFGHLAAGTHEIQRIGDDTSGVSWNRNRRMGVNTLAFRAAQHGKFFEIDPDIVSFTKSIPFPLVEQWLRLVSQSGAALFVAMDPGLVEAKHRDALKKALTIAAKRQPVGEPLDWMDTQCPRRWKLMGKEQTFNWMGESGAWPFSD